MLVTNSIKAKTTTKKEKERNTMPGKQNHLWSRSSPWAVST